MPEPQSMRHLGAAVVQVILQNKRVGYPPNRFANLTASGTAPDLIQVCERLLTSEAAFAEIVEAVWFHPNVLTLEEVIAGDADPSKFGLSPVAIASARERTERLRDLRDRNSKLPGV